MSIRINIGASFDATDIKKARREINALEDQLLGLNGRLGDQMRSWDKWGSRLTSLGAGLTSAITVPVVGLGAAATTMAANFSESMSRITGLVGIAADEVKAMESAVLELSGRTAKAPRELGDALFVVTSAGLRGAEAMEALEFAAKAGAAGLGQTRDIARAVAGAMNAYGAATLGAAEATDIIVATARAGNFATEQFASRLGDVLPLAKQSQASLEDVGGAIALLTRTNGDAAKSITNLTALFRFFAIGSEQGRKILDDVGLSMGALRDIIEERGLVAALQTLDRALGGNREQLGRALSSSEAASAAFQILESDAATLAGTFGVVNDAAGLTEEAFGVVSGEPAFKFRQALNDIQVAGVNLGNELLPLVTRIIERFSELIGRFNGLDESQRRFAIALGLAAAAAGPLLILMGAFATTVAALIPLVGSLGAAVAVATGGLSLLAAAVAGVAYFGFIRDTQVATTEMRRMERAALDAQFAQSELGREILENQRAQANSAYAARLAGEAAYYAEGGFSALTREQREARRQTEEVTETTDEAADALASLGEVADGTSPAAAGPKIVSLTRSMRDLFQELNETYVGAGDTGDAIAQFSREVLAMGNITEQTSRGAERLAQVIRQDIDRALADANRRLDDAVGKFNAYRDSIAAGIRSGNTLADATRNQAAAQDALARAQEAYEQAVASEDEDRIADAAKDLADAEANQKTFLEFLGVGVTTAEGFAAQIDALREAGASLEVVQQIAELGARTGGRVAAELLAGGAAAIEQANNMVAAVENASRRAGIAAAEQFFGAGVNAAKAMVRGIEATIPELQGVLDRIADAIERAMGTRPNVDISGKQGPFIPQDSPGTPSRGGTSIGGVPWSPSWVRGGAEQIAAIRAVPLSAFDNFTVPGLADGGLVMRPTLAMIGEAGPEVAIPLDRLGGMGATINVTVTSADPEAVVEALRRYTRNNGALGQVVTL